MSSPQGADPDLDAWRQAHQSARAAWPEIDLPADLFLPYLRARLPAEDPLRTLPFVLPADLYLCCACVRGLPAALSAFEARYLSRVPELLAHLRPDPAFADEVRQSLRERLLVSADGSPPRISEYAGRGALIVWLRVAALRAALNLRRTDERHLHEKRRDALLHAALPPRLDPELDYLRARYAAEFRDALRAAVSALSAEQRAILRLYWVGGKSGEQIAALFHVNRSTVTRWLAQSRAAILAETRRLLGERLRLSAEEFESLARMVRSHLDVSLSTLLAEEEG